MNIIGHHFRRKYCTQGNFLDACGAWRSTGTRRKSPKIHAQTHRHMSASKKRVLSVYMHIQMPSSLTVQWCHRFTQPYPRNRSSLLDQCFVGHQQGQIFPWKLPPMFGVCQWKYSLKIRTKHVKMEHSTRDQNISPAEGSTENFPVAIKTDNDWVARILWFLLSVFFYWYCAGFYQPHTRALSAFLGNKPRAFPQTGHGAVSVLKLLLTYFCCVQWPQCIHFCKRRTEIRWFFGLTACHQSLVGRSIYGCLVFCTDLLHAYNETYTQTHTHARALFRSVIWLCE